MSEIWTEKYRPKTLKDMKGQNNIISRLSAFVEKKSVPHLLFSGPAGSGKSTAALCIAQELYGDNWHSNFLELNASDERGIDTVRNKIKDFAKTVPFGHKFKIIYLDEADSLTKDAQHALRRTMEKYSDTTRFILACNYMSRIILPIQSRCAAFRFTSLNKENVTEYLKAISASENVNVDDDAYDVILDIAEGDMRKAINTLQTASVMKKTVTGQLISEVALGVDSTAVKDMLDAAVNKNFKKARDMLLELMVSKGSSGDDIVKEVYKQIYTLNIEDEKKLLLLEKLGEYEFRLVEGSNPRIQLEAMLASFAVMK
jgi:replication factor C small subunit